jgi:predicted alpha/beta-hydrolase family hydrolase
MKIKVSDKIGSVSAEITKPAKPKAVLVLAHGAGAGMDHPFMKSLCDELAALGIATLRFNFPFTENKKGRPDVPPVAHATIEAATAKGVEEFPKIPLFVGGKSFGGRMSSQLLSSKKVAGVSGLVFVGFPLHQPGNPSIERAEHLKEVKVPMLFLQGTHDALADIKLVKQVTKKLKLATVIEFENADHSFKAPKQNLIPKLAEEIASWVTSR